MGRAERRKIDKMIKKTLTDEQYEDCKQQTINEKVNQEIDRFIGNFIVVFKEAMKEFRISEERADKIIFSMAEKTRQRYSEGKVGESRPEDRYVESDDFEKIATAVLEDSVGLSSKEVAKLLYQAFMKEGIEQ
jgi:hypothetical protein